MSEEIRKKDGTIYNSCPFIDQLLSLCDSQSEIISKMRVELENVRKINEALRFNQEDKSKIEEAIKKAKEEIWEEVADTIGSRRRYVESDLKDMVKTIEVLEKENRELLKEMEDIKNGK